MMIGALPDISAAIVQTAQDYGVDPRLALEIAIVESGLNPAAVGAKGEVGVFQLRPETAADFGVNPYDADENIRGGVAYLAWLSDRFGDPAMVAAAYNWGPERVAEATARYGADWLSQAPQSTQSYVQRILANISEQYSVAFSPAAGVEAAMKNIFAPASTPGSPGVPNLPRIGLLAALVLLVGLASSHLIAESAG